MESTKIDKKCNEKSRQKKRHSNNKKYFKTWTQQSKQINNK